MVGNKQPAPFTGRAVYFYIGKAYVYYKKQSPTAFKRSGFLFVHKKTAKWCVETLGGIIPSKQIEGMLFFSILQTNPVNIVNHPQKVGGLMPEAVPSASVRHIEGSGVHTHILSILVSLCHEVYLVYIQSVTKRNHHTATRIKVVADLLRAPLNGDHVGRVVHDVDKRRAHRVGVLAENRSSRTASRERQSEQTKQSNDKPVRIHTRPPFLVKL